MGHSPTDAYSKKDKRTTEGIKVYIFGGGVAGLTAAHELVLRGFEVCLYESERALGPQGAWDAPSLGGMARTQYAAVAGPPRRAEKPVAKPEGETSKPKEPQPPGESAKPEAPPAGTPLSSSSHDGKQSGSSQQGEEDNLYYRGAFLNVLADRFLWKHANKSDRQNLIRGLAPLQTEATLFEFFKRAFIGGLASSPDENEALENFFNTLTKHVGKDRKLVRNFASAYKLPGATKVLKALDLKLGKLPENFRMADVKRNEYIVAFKEEIKGVFEKIRLTAADLERLDMMEVVKDSRVALEQLPPSRRLRKATERVLASAYVRALQDALWPLIKKTGKRKENIRGRVQLLKFLKDFLTPQGKKDLLPYLPGHVAEPLIMVLRRLLAGKMRDTVRREEKSDEDKNLNLAPDQYARPTRVNLGRRQGPESARYFPQFWLHFKDGTSELTEVSQATWNKAIKDINNLFKDGDLNTEKGRLADVRIYVQSFRDPNLTNPDEDEGETDPDEDGGKGNPTLQAGRGDPATQVIGRLKKPAYTPHERPPRPGGGTIRRQEEGFEKLEEALQETVRNYKEVQGGLVSMFGQPGHAPALLNSVRVIVYRPQIPGEHGYRFFPSYYRHVFDTMERIPLQDENRQPIGGTVLDNMVSLPQIGIFSENSAPFLMSWNPLQVGDALSRLDYNLRNASNLHIQSQDLLQFSLRVLRYMTSCSERRAEEMEEPSWWDYLEGYDPRTKTRLYRYSEPFKHLVQSSSRVLAALDGAYGDARTCGNTYVQLLTQALVPTPQNNCTLNGPTSESWFFHWRAHLKRLGVQFRHGELQSLELSKNGELFAQVYRPALQKVEHLPFNASNMEENLKDLVDDIKEEWGSRENLKKVLEKFLIEEKKLENADVKEEEIIEKILMEEGKLRNADIKANEGLGNAEQEAINGQEDSKTKEKVIKNLIKKILKDRGEGKKVYFVLATDLLSAEQVTKRLPQGIAPRLKDYVRKVPEKQGSSHFIKRSPDKKFTRQRWDRLQTISGIQYFFKRHVNLFDGYLYCVDAEWGLSAICSHLVWQDRPIGQLSVYQSILSVDIGDWNTPSKRLEKKAWQCTPQELKEEVLHQLRVSLRARGPNQNLASFVLPDPDWTHIDESLEYGCVEKKQPSDQRRANEPFVEEPPKEKLLRNKTPYLVPIAGDWKNRPGPEPWDPTYQSFLTAPWTYDKEVWQAPHGGYPVHYGRLVFAGTYLRTFTRMTTMESANESARHAVNAILDHCTAELASEVRQGFWNSPAGGTLSNPYEKGIFPTTPFGDYCRIWNPERNELPDFELLQRQDEQNWREKRPHPWDAVGLEALPSLLTQVYSSGDLLDQLLKRVASRNKESTRPASTVGWRANEGVTGSPTSWQPV